MKHKALFVALIFVMIGAIAFGIIAENRMVSSVSKNKEYIDEYVAKIDKSFVFQSEEAVDKSHKRFYYVSEKYPSFTLTVEVNTVDGDAKITDNYSSLQSREGITQQFEQMFGDGVIVQVRNSENLNSLPTVEETLLYNNFNLSVGIDESQYSKEKVAVYKEILLNKKIDCTVYFYSLTTKQMQEGFPAVDGEAFDFNTYIMFIIENNNVVTEICYD